MTSRIKTFLGAGLAVAMLGAAIPAIAAGMDAVKERQQTMKSISKANKVVQRAAKGEANAMEAKKAAEEIVMLADKLPTLFPSGTSRVDMPMDTRAKPDIWAQMDKFKAAAGNLKSKAQMVASANGDMALQDAAEDLRGACGNCHKPFRGPKPKK